MSAEDFNAGLEQAARQLEKTAVDYDGSAQQSKVKAGSGFSTSRVVLLNMARSDRETANLLRALASDVRRLKRGARRRAPE